MLPSAKHQTGKLSYYTTFTCTLKYYDKIPHAFSTNKSLPDATNTGVSSVVVTCAMLKNSFPTPSTANPMSVLLESSVVVGNIVDVVGILTILQSSPVYSLLQ